MHSETTPSIIGDLAPLSDRPGCVVQDYSAEPLHTQGELLALGFAGDGTLWSVEEPGVLRQWDLSTTRQRAEHLLEDVATTWAFAPGCRLVASGADELSLWDVASGQLLAAFGNLPWVSALAFTADGRWMASGHDNGSIRIWDIDHRKVLHELTGAHKMVSALAFSPDGKTLASAGEEKQVHLWKISSGEPYRTLSGHKDRIPFIVWHPSLPRVISAGWDTTVRVWDANSGEPVVLLNSHATQVHTIAISPDGNLLASADSGDTIHLWDLGRNREVKVWSGNGAEVRCIAFSPDGRRVACGGADRVILVKDVHRDESTVGPTEGLGFRSGVAVTPDGKRLFGLSPTSSLHSWDVATAERAVEPQDAGVMRTFALSPDGKTIAGSLAIEVPEERLKFGGTGIPSLFFWDVDSGKRRKLFDGQAPPITALAFSPDGKLLASANYLKSDVWVWDALLGQPALIIPGAIEGCSVEAMAFHPQGNYLAVGGIDWMATSGSDGAVALWDVKERAQLVVFGQGTTALAFHPDGKRLATAGLKRSVQIWRVPEGEIVKDLEPASEPVSSVAFSPDGRWLAVSSDDFRIRLWRGDTLTLVADVLLDTLVKGLCFSSDGTYLFTSNARSGSYQLLVEQMIADGA